MSLVGDLAKFIKPNRINLHTNMTLNFLILSARHLNFNTSIHNGHYTSIPRVVHVKPCDSYFYSVFMGLDFEKS